MTAPQASSFGIRLTTLALIVAVVGGLGSVAGAFLAGILLGIIDRFASAYIGQFYTTVILLLCAAGMIVIRPSGLLGKRA
jgi:branched-chain amino acid transport system permease protein